MMKKIYAGKSRIAGEGLFTSEDAKKGELVCYIKGYWRKKVNKSLRDTLANPDWIGVGKNLWIDPILPFKRLNHSCDPNTGIKGRVSLYAIKSIRAHDELTIDYSTIEADDRWQLEGGIKCKCGASDCRGTIRSIQYLPKKKFKQYLPFIPTSLIELYTKGKVTL